MNQRKNMLNGEIVFEQRKTQIFYLRQEFFPSSCI